MRWRGPSHPAGWAVLVALRVGTVGELACPTVPIMLTDPVALLVLVLAVTVVLQQLRLRRVRQQPRRDARALAEAVGHPSAGLRTGSTHAERLLAADDACDQLAAAGLIATRPILNLARVHAMGMDGQYTLTVARSGVYAGYQDNIRHVSLGVYAAVRHAVEAIIEHDGVSPRP